MKNLSNILFISTSTTTTTPDVLYLPTRWSRRPVFRFIINYYFFLYLMYILFIYRIYWRPCDEPRRTKRACASPIGCPPSKTPMTLWFCATEPWWRAVTINNWWIENRRNTRTCGEFNRTRHRRQWNKSQDGRIIIVHTIPLIIVYNTTASNGSMNRRSG